MKNTLMLILLFIIVLVFLCFFSGRLLAQEVKLDSIKQDSVAFVNNMRSVGESDGRKQRLSSAELHTFFANKKRFRNDLFSPRDASASNQALLTDSNYVKAFRKGAYQQAIDDLTNIPKSIWGAVGPGVNNGATSNGINFAINGAAEVKTGQFIGADIRVNGSLFGGTTVSAYSLLYGGIFKQESSFLTVSTGVSVIDVSTTNLNLFSDSPAVTTNTTDVGLPLIVQGYFVVHQTVGFGVSAFAILTYSRVLVGASLSFAFGRLATHIR